MDDVFDVVLLDNNVWEKVVDVVFDMVVDLFEDVDVFVKKDVEFFVVEYGWSIEEVVEGLEIKVVEISEREVKKELGIILEFRVDFVFFFKD